MPTLAAFIIGALMGGVLGWVAGGRGAGSPNATNVAIGCIMGIGLVALFRWVILNDVLSESSGIDPGTYDKDNVGAHAPDADTPLKHSADVTHRVTPRRHA